MIPRRTASIAALAAAAQYAEVAEKRPRFMPNPVGLGVLEGAEKAITNASRRDRREPLAALGEYLTAAETPAQQLRHNPGDASARRDYNFALGRVFATIRDAELDPWTQPLPVPLRAANSCSRTSPTRARSGTPRFTSSCRPTSSTSAAPTSRIIVELLAMNAKSDV